MQVTLHHVTRDPLLAVPVRHPVIPRGLYVDAGRANQRRQRRVFRCTSSLSAVPVHLFRKLDQPFLLPEANCSRILSAAAYCNIVELSNIAFPITTSPTFVRPPAPKSKAPVGVPIEGACHRAKSTSSIHSTSTTRDDSPTPFEQLRQWALTREDLRLFASSVRLHHAEERLATNCGHGRLMP
jgi:hypothetical protein